MGTTAEKLTYLNDTKQLLKENINSLGGNLTNEPFRQYASVLEGIYERIPKVSGIGTNLSLSPTMVGKIKLNEIDGDTLQDGTPTPDTPVEIQSVTGLQNIEICGKNLFNKDSGFINAYIDTSGVIHNNANTNALFTYMKVQSNTTYTFSCNTSLRNLGINEFNSSKAFILRTQSQNVSSLTITTSSTTNYLRLQLNYDNTTTVTQEIIDSLNIQLEQGSTATEYEPYKGNTYEVNLGKNLLDYSTMQDGYVNGSGGITVLSSSDNEEMYSEFIKVKPSTTYTFKIFETSFSGNNWFGVGEYTTNNVSNFVRRDTMTTSTQNYITFITSATTQYVILSARGLKTATKVQFEQGNATEYTPYFTPIKLNKIGDYQDSIKKSTGKNIITTYNYASSGYINYNYDNSKIGKTMTYSFIPNFSTTNAALYIRANISISSYNVGTISTITSGTKVSVTFTLTDEQYDTIKNTTGGYIQVYKSGVSMDENSISNPMLEINNQATDYEPYLPKGTWYLEKQIGKVVLDGSESWTYNSSSHSPFTLLINDIVRPTSNSEKAKLFCDKYVINSFDNANSTNYGLSMTSTANNFRFRNIDITSLASWTTWLNTNNTTVYYVLSTPTTTEITNTELINQLESLKSQEGITNIAITSENLPMIINASALKGDAE